ncbi:MAG: potassium transporter Kup [Gammaproteobacteria bacterium]
MSGEGPSHGEAGAGRLRMLTLGALGIVYGDIGTSPLYALRECFSGVLAPVEANVLGILSLMFWSLILVVSIKYVVFMLRADNRGEGGILALMTLVAEASERRRGIAWLVIAGLLGTAFIYADAMITPAISVLSAVEGLESVAPRFEHFVIPIALTVLFGLYLSQRFGTERIGSVFGPIMLAWFALLGVLGAVSIAHTPHVLAAVDPRHAIDFFVGNGWLAFTLLGTVFLVITGGEALYADMGHFGRLPIRVAWFAIVLPGLLLNYFGQGALLLREPHALGSLFYSLAPQWALVPFVVLATCATVIASQAVISGAFSMTSQAIQLGYCPRLRVVQTSNEVIGQVYIPGVNWGFLAGTVALVLHFETSSRLASAYGIAVAAAMLLTTLFLYFVARRVWGWSRALAAAFSLPFLVVQSAFLLSTLLKIPTGGWFPIAIAVLIYVALATWARGRSYLTSALDAESLPLELFLSSLGEQGIVRVPGTAVYLTRQASAVPRALLHNLKHNKVLHEKVVLLTVLTERIPTVDEDERGDIRPLGQGFYCATLRYGYTQRPAVPIALTRVAGPHIDIDMMDTTFFLGRETLILGLRPRLMLPRLRRALFAFMQHNALDAARFFRIPPNRVVELGSQIEI